MKMNKLNYNAPQVTVIALSAERGFAQSHEDDWYKYEGNDNFDWSYSDDENWN